MPPDIPQLEGPAFRKLPDYTDQVEVREEINETNTRNGDEIQSLEKEMWIFHCFSFLRQDFDSSDYQYNKFKIVLFSLDRF